MNPLRIASAQTHKQTSIRYYSRMLVYFCCGINPALENLLFPFHWHICRFGATSKIQNSFLGGERGGVLWLQRIPPRKFPFSCFPFTGTYADSTRSVKSSIAFLERGAGETVLWLQRMVSPANIPRSSPRHRQKLVATLGFSGWGRPFSLPKAMHLSSQAILSPRFFMVIRPSSSIST